METSKIKISNELLNLTENDVYVYLKDGSINLYPKSGIVVYHTYKYGFELNDGTRYAFSDVDDLHTNKFIDVSDIDIGNSSGVIVNDRVASYFKNKEIYWSKWNDIYSPDFYSDDVIKNDNIIGVRRLLHYASVTYKP